MNKSISSFIAQGWLIRLKTKHPDGTEFDCIPVAENKSLVAVQEITAFEADGIVVLPKKWILRIRNGEFERAANAIIRHERTIDNVPAYPVELSRFSSLKQLISDLRAGDVWPAIEIIHKKKGIVYVGSISDVFDKSFRLQCYSASGEWTEESEFDYAEVFKVEIESKYIAHFNRYMRTKAPPKTAKES